MASRQEQAMYEYERESEWDFRAPTLADQVSQLRRDWDGPRCPHGTPIAHFGPDLICNECEWDEYEGDGEAEVLAPVAVVPVATGDDDVPF